MEENNFNEIVNETVEKLKGLSYSTATKVLEEVKRQIDHSLTLS